MNGKRFHCAVIFVFLIGLLAGCAPGDAAVQASLTPPPTPANTAASEPTPTTVPTQPTETPARSVSGPPLPIRLQYGEFDPLAGEPALPEALRLDAAETARTADEALVYIVQFDGPVLEEWQKALDETGAERMGYVAEYAYLVRMRPSQKSAVEALPHVRWIGLYQPGYKIAPELLAESTSAGREKIMILTFPGVDMDAIQAKVRESGGIVEESNQTEQSGTMLVEIDLKQVVELARLPGVMWIEPWTMPTLH